MTHRLDSMFQRLTQEGRTGLFPYLTVGFPAIDDTLSLAPALAEAGADLIELGVPFSDPIADGPTIQAASFDALQNGVTLDKCLEVCKTLRDNGLETPLVLMGYYNPILSYGLDAFARDAAQAGADGAIVPDLPPEESAPLREALKAQGLPLVSLLTPTSTDERIAEACAEAEGFIYCVTVTGVTGARRDVSTNVFELLDRIRKHTTLPIAVGFGISERAHVESLAGHAQAAAVGSALINVIHSAPPDERLRRAGDFIAKLAGRQS